MDAIPYVETAEIRLDGLPSDEAWANASPAGAFVTSLPAPGHEPTGATEVRLLSDERRLYALFVASDPEPTRIRAGFGRRDTRTLDDGVALLVDPAGRGQRAYVFGCNPVGSVYDGIRTRNAEEDDLAWDARWDCAARRTADGYVVEMAIPWRAIRHPTDVAQLGILAERRIARVDEQSTWPAIDPMAPSLVAQASKMGGPGTLPTSRGLDLIPELTFGVDQDGLADDRLGAYGLGPGLTARYAPSPELQLLGTVNPDFSQVESDAAQVTVNRRYALEYEEKRPFFLEGQEWFEHVAGPLVYTRSMAVPLYGGRATLEAGPWTVALLHVLDRHPTASVSEGGGFDEAAIGDAWALETVGRARYSLPGGSWVGVIGSDRTLPDAELSSRLGGVDTGVQIGDRWVWTGAALASSTTGVDHGTLAPAAETGLTYGAERLQVFADLTWYSPGFRAENGFLVYADRLAASGGMYARSYPEHGAVKQWLWIPAQGEAAFTTAGDPRSYEWEPEVKARFDNGWRAQTSVFVNGEAFAGAWLDYQQPNVGLGGPLGPWIDLWARAYMGTGPFYDELAPRIGHEETEELELSVQVGRRLTVAVVGQADRMVDVPSLLPADGDVLFAGYVARVQAIAFATARVWARVIVDRTTFDARTTSELLLAWERRPGTALYLGGAAGWPDGAGVPDQWVALAKVSWSIGL